MGDAEHCRLLDEAANLELKQQGAGRELWNNWRIANPEVIPDLNNIVCSATSQGSGLHPVGSGIKLIGFDFSRANLSNSFFSMANFEGANLSEAEIANATVCWGNFSRANLQRANLKNVNFNRADLARADLSNADLQEAQLGRANFKGAVLRGADLSGAILNKAVFSRPKYAKIDDRASLRGANLSRAFLIEADLSGADLIEADLSEAQLTEADLQDADLCEAKLIKAQLWGADLRSAFLMNTDLSGAKLGGAKLSVAHFIGANLLETDLTMIEAVGTNFKKAILTGACIEDWNISNRTNLDGVICDYVYLKRVQQQRRPHTGNFAPGEFTKLFQKARETLDLIFLNGIDWQAFLVSFQQLQVEAGDKVLSIQAIENKNDGAFVVRVSVPPELNKAEIEQYFKRKYQLALEAKDKQYRKYLRERLKDKDDLIAKQDEQITSIRKNNTELIRIIKTMAEKENYKTENTFNIYDSSGSVANQGYIGSSGNQNTIGNAAGDVKGDQKSIQHIHNYTLEQKQSLVETAAEIQTLLRYLEYNNPTIEKQAVVEEAKRHIESKPTLKARVIGALKNVSVEGFKELIDHPLANMFVAGVEGWRNPS